jgi:two-component system OmpR family response regulator
MERRGTLLLVEDEHILRSLVAQFLASENFRVIEAADGPTGVARFADSGPFDLALVDLNLPGFSGVEVCRRIKRIKSDQPIMICSAAIMSDNEEALLAMGIDQFLTKPYHPEALLSCILEALAAKVPAASRATP